MQALEGPPSSRRGRDASARVSSVFQLLCLLTCQQQRGISSSLPISSPACSKKGREAECEGKERQKHGAKKRKSQRQMEKRAVKFLMEVIFNV